MRRIAIPAIRSSRSRTPFWRDSCRGHLRVAVGAPRRQCSDTSSLVKDTRPVRVRHRHAGGLLPGSCSRTLMPTVLCVGIAVLDHVFAVEAIPTRPEKHRAKDLAVVGGGIAANAAVAVARLGGRAALATRLGNDGTGNAIAADLEAEGVDCSPTRRFEGQRSPTSAILVDRHGERLVVSYSDPNLPSDPAVLPQRLSPDVKAVLGDTRWP